MLQQRPNGWTLRGVFRQTLADKVLVGRRPSLWYRRRVFVQNVIDDSGFLFNLFVGWAAGRELVSEAAEGPDIYLFGVVLLLGYLRGEVVHRPQHGLSSF